MTDLMRLSATTALAAGTLLLIPGVAAAQSPTTPAQGNVANCSALAGQAAIDAGCDKGTLNADPNLAPPTAVEQGRPSTTPNVENAGGSADAIVVTGSRIARPNLDSAMPITSVSASELKATGNISIGDALNQLPSLGSTYSQSNSTRFIGTAGINALDLRRLGTARTLVLVNGRRHITSTPGINQVDVNTIPADLLERTDVVTGGDSSTYGSDAVAGVVNFILKRNYEGFAVRGQGGVTSHGDRGSYFMSGVAGKNFSEGRGNVAVAFEYARQNPLYYTDREGQYGAYAGRSQFNATQNTIGESAAGDGIPDTTFLHNIKNLGISEGGAYTSTCPSAAGARATLNCTGELSNTGAALGRVFVFDANGNLVPNIPTRDLRPYGSGNGVGGLGSTLRLTGQLDPGLTRYATNVLAHYDFADAFRPYFEGSFVRVNALQQGQPTFGNYTFSINNPFLSTQARNLLLTSLAPGATTFTAQRFNIDFGGRGEQHRRDSLEVVGGVEGTFNEDWKYDVSVNYGRLRTTYTTAGNILTARFNNSLAAVRNSAGQIVCSINADANPANDDPGCVPVNLFGYQAPSAAALSYFGYNSVRKQHAGLLDLSGYISGDLSQLFELPGGPIGFAFGGEYREETAFAYYDAPTAQGLTFLNAIPNFQPPKLKVKEGYAEVRIPFLKDIPFVNELSVEAGARVSDYNIGRTGTVWTYNAGVSYAPVAGLRFRGSYARSVRAPTQSDLYGANSQTFLNGLVDPCSQSNINNNPNRVANCAAAGVPTTEIVNGVRVPFTNTPSSGILGLNGSNANLEAERSTSYTFGAVAQPRAIPGLSISVDYYNIKIKNVIFSLAAQTIIDQCYNSPSGINNQYCASVFRNADGTFQGQSDRIVGGTTVSFPRTGVSFISGPFNFARQVTSGIDVDVGYRRALSSNVTFNVRGLVSYVFKRNNYTDVSRPDYIDQQLGELGDPFWRANLNLGMTVGKFDFTYTFRYIGRMSIGTWETQHSVQGRAPENPDAYPFVYYPAVTYHTLRVGVKPTDRSHIYFGVDNIFDKQPPYGLDGTTSGSALYDNIGRFFYAGVEVNF